MEEVYQEGEEGGGKSWKQEKWGGTENRRLSCIRAHAPLFSHYLYKAQQHYRIHSTVNAIEMCYFLYEEIPPFMQWMSDLNEGHAVREKQANEGKIVRGRVPQRTLIGIGL